MEYSLAKSAYKNHRESSNDISNVRHTKGRDNGMRKTEAKGSGKYMTLHEPDIDRILGFETKAGNASNVVNMPTRFSSSNEVTSGTDKPDAKRRPSTPASSDTNGDAQQALAVPQTAERATRKHQRDLQPTLRSIDKVMIDAPLSDDEIASAIEICKTWRKEGRATQITNQSGYWQAVYVFYLDPDRDASHSKNPSVTLYFQSRGNNSSVAFRLQLNPHHIERHHVQPLKHMWEQLFSYRWRDVRLAARIYRGDEAWDFGGVLDDILLDRKASQVKDNYFIKTNRKGGIQSQYIGEATAASRGIIYDRELAELFRNDRGQAVPLNRETATQILEHPKDSPTTIRVESRRVFEAKLTYTQFAQTRSAFSEFNVFDLSRLRPRDRLDNGFMLYVEWVRLRGVHGAKHKLFQLQGENADTKRRIVEYEACLARTQCECWLQMDRVQQLGVLLNALPVNSFLKRIGN
jgi:hypothetical protein